MVQLHLSPVSRAAPVTLAPTELDGEDMIVDFINTLGWIRKVSNRMKNSTVIVSLNGRACYAVWG